MSSSSPAAQQPYWSNPTSPASIAAAAAAAASASASRHVVALPLPASYRIEFSGSSAPSAAGGGIMAGSAVAEVDSPPQNLMNFIVASTNAGIVGHFDQEGSARARDDSGSASSSSGGNDSSDDSMPPLEDIGPPPPSMVAGASSAAAAASSPPWSPMRSSNNRSGDTTYASDAAGADALSTTAFASPKGAARAYDSNDGDDDDSVIEIVDLLSRGDSPTDDLPPSGRTRSHDRQSASGSTAAGLKTTGLDEDMSTTATSTRGKRKRSAPGKSDDNDTNDAIDADDKDDEKPSPSTDQEHSCSICLDRPSRKDVTTLNACEHIFCFECIEKWAERENTCPLCKVRFNEIERVHKPPPSKRRKKGSSGGGGKRGKSAATRATKKIKNRDQIADLADANPLASLFETMEATGNMPRSIAQLIFSGLGGIRVGRAARSFGEAGRDERINIRRSARNQEESSHLSGSTTRRGSAAGRSRRRVTVGSSSASSAAASGTSRVSITVNSHGPTSVTFPGPPPAYLGLGPNDAASAADANPFARFSGRRTARRSSSTSSELGGSDVPDDDGVPDLHSASGGYDTFVRRARASAASSASSGPGRSSSSPAAARAGGYPFPPFPPPGAASRPVWLSAPPTRRGVPPADTADTAIEIGDSDSDDDEVICVD